MGLKELEEKIKERTEEEARKILEEAEKKREEILREGKKEAERIRERIISCKKEEAERERKKEIVEVKLEERGKILEEKNKLLEEVFKGVEKRLNSLPEEEYLSLLEKWILENLEETKNLIFSPKDRTLVENKLLKTLEGKLKEKEKNIGVLFELPQEIKGVIIEKEGKRVNLTFPALLDRLRDIHEVEIARILFGEKDEEG